MLTIEIANQQSVVTIDQERMRQAVESILRDAGISDARLSLAVVDDPTIHQLNRQYLEHDYATDVLSFLLEREGEHLEGEVIVSAETAARAATEYDWPPGDELLLYVVHGTLHLVGHDDATPSQRTAMQREEQRYLVQFGLQPPRRPSGS